MILKNDILDNALDEIIETHKESLEKLANNSNSKDDHIDPEGVSYTQYKSSVVWEKRGKI